MLKIQRILQALTPRCRSRCRCAASRFPTTPWRPPSSLWYARMPHKHTRSSRHPACGNPCLQVLGMLTIDAILTPVSPLSALCCCFHDCWCLREQPSCSTWVRQCPVSANHLHCGLPSKSWPRSLSSMDSKQPSLMVIACRSRTSWFTSSLTPASSSGTCSSCEAPPRPCTLSGCLACQRIASKPA